MTTEIIPILCNEKNMANYAYIIADKQNSKTFILDAAEANPILREL